MKPILSVLVCLIAFSQAGLAKDNEFSPYLNLPYAQARPLLLQQGWHAVPNPRIQESSIYAQQLHDSQFEEVLDCISMERDQSQFVLAKGKRVVVVTTKEKTLSVDSIQKQR